MALTPLRRLQRATVLALVEVAASTVLPAILRAASFLVPVPGPRPPRLGRCAVGAKTYTDVMSLSASEFYEAALALPPSVRKDIAVRLLESVEVVDDDSIEEAWTYELSSRVDDIRSCKVTTIPGEQVFADIAAGRAAHNA